MVAMPVLAFAGLLLLAPAAAFRAGVQPTPYRLHGEDTRMALGPAPSTTKVVVFGGNGFVGSRVCQLLQGTGAKVVSVSRSGGQPEWAAGEDWVGGVEWVKGEACTDDLSGIISGSSAVVSCLGVIGGSDETMRAGNGAANVAIVKQAGTVGRIVYVSVSDEVGKAVGGFALKGYFNGKREAEEAVSTATSSVILAPTFIYGGTEFSATPPRVAQGYGSFVEGALSLAPIRWLADALPGVLGLALRPPVSVTAVATAAAGAALGKVPAGQRFDGTDEINQAAQLAVTGGG